MILIWCLLSVACGAIGYWFGRRKIVPMYRPLEDLNGLSKDLSSSAEQVVLISKEIDSSSREQLDVLSNTVSASHQIRSMVDRTLENTSMLQESSGLLMGLVDSGNDIVQSMVLSSQLIKDGAENFRAELQSSVQELNSTLSVINEIAKKTEIINEIVLQTKLLSFNASVEAARAGEAGKGFSVVAEEVGKLAQMSGSAADEISSIVAKSLQLVSRSIDSTREKIETLSHETLEKGEAGFVNAKNCEHIFSKMRASIAQTVEMISMISQAAREQALGVGQLDQSISVFQEVTEKNRLVASQATNQSTAFKNDTTSLQSIVSTFAKLIGFKNLTNLKVYKRFIWNDSLVLNIESMDDQHQVLIEKINNLIDSLENYNKGKCDKAEVQSCFKAMASYTVEHFAAEESYMESVKYPQLNSHKRIHKGLLERVAQFSKELEQDSLDDLKLSSFLRNWLISHIMGVDMQYSHHVHAQSKNQAA